MNGNYEEIKRIEKIAREMRKSVLNMALVAGNKASHFGAGTSIVDILATLYGGIMKFDCKNPKWEERDRFILSKGHGVLGYYAALAEVGYIKKEELNTFEKNNSSLLGHPVINREKGIEFTNGSLGMGLSIGVGVALAAKKQNKNNKIYVLLGDGECNEGSVWEAFMSAAQYKLNNVVAIIDHNKLQLGGSNKDIMSIDNMYEKLKSFNWSVEEVDGHNIECLYNILKRENKSDKPLAIIAHTIKGKGFSFSENNNSWHHAILTQNQYDMAMQELMEQEE